MLPVMSLPIEIIQPPLACFSAPLFHLFLPCLKVVETSPKSCLFLILLGYYADFVGRIMDEITLSPSLPPPLSEKARLASEISLAPSLFCPPFNRPFSVESSPLPSVSSVTSFSPSLLALHARLVGSTG